MSCPLSFVLVLIPYNGDPDASHEQPTVIGGYATREEAQHAGMDATDAIYHATGGKLSYSDLNVNKFRTDAEYLKWFSDRGMDHSKLDHSGWIEFRVIPESETPAPQPVSHAVLANWR